MAVAASRGSARQGSARFGSCGVAGSGSAGRGRAVEARYGAAWSVGACSGLVWQLWHGLARRGKVRFGSQGTARHGVEGTVWQLGLGWSRLGAARQGWARQSWYGTLGSVQVSYGMAVMVCRGPLRHGEVRFGSYGAVWQGRARSGSAWQSRRVAERSTLNREGGNEP